MIQFTTLKDYLDLSDWYDKEDGSIMEKIR